MDSPVTLSQVRLEWVRRSGHLPLSFNVAREVCRYLKHPQSHLYEISPNGIKEFDIGKHAWGRIKPFNQPINWDVNSRYTTLESGRIFGCGGETTSDFSNRAYIFEVTESAFTVKELPRMCERRSLSGVVFADDSIYVFGGYGRPYLKSGELYSFRDNWESLSATMHSGRSQFNPCYFYDLQRSLRVIYLPGGRNQTIETYDVVKRTFSVVPSVQLPAGSGTLSWIQNNKLCVLSRKYYSVLSLVNGDLRSTPQSSSFCNPRAAPVFISPCLYWVQEGGHCFRVDFEGENVQFADLG